MDAKEDGSGTVVGYGVSKEAHLRDDAAAHSLPELLGGDSRAARRQITLRHSISLLESLEALRKFVEQGVKVGFRLGGRSDIQFS